MVNIFMKVPNYKYTYQPIYTYVYVSIHRCVGRSIQPIYAQISVDRLIDLSK